MPLKAEGHAEFFKSITNSFEQNPWQANNHSASQEIPCISWDLEVHHHVHKNHHWSLFSARWIQSTTSHSVSLRTTCFLRLIFSHLCLGRLSCYLPSGFKFVTPAIPTWWPYNYLKCHPVLKLEHLMLGGIIYDEQTSYKKLGRTCEVYFPLN